MKVWVGLSTELFNLVIFNFCTAVPYCSIAYNIKGHSMSVLAIKRIFITSLNNWILAVAWTLQEIEYERTIFSKQVWPKSVRIKWPGFVTTAKVFSDQDIKPLWSHLSQLDQPQQPSWLKCLCANQKRHNAQEYDVDNIDHFENQQKNTVTMDAFIY